MKYWTTWKWEGSHTDMFVWGLLGLILEEKFPIFVFYWNYFHRIYYDHGFPSLSLSRSYLLIPNFLSLSFKKTIIQTRQTRIKQNEQTAKRNNMRNKLAYRCMRTHVHGHASPCTHTYPACTHMQHACVYMHTYMHAQKQTHVSKTHKNLKSGQRSGGVSL